MNASKGDQELEGPARTAMVAIEALPGLGVLVFDGDLRFVLCGGDLLTALGYIADATIGRTLFDVVPTHISRVLASGYRAALRGESNCVQVSSLDGERTYDVDVVPLEGGLGMAVFRNVTAELQIEQDRRRLAMQFRTAFDDSAIGTAVVAPDGTLLRVNEAMARLLGYELEVLEGMTFQAVTHPDDLDADLALYKETLAGHRDHYEVERRYVRADGSTVWTLLSMSVLRDPHSAVVHFIGHLQDISERRALEQRLTFLAEHDAMTGLRNRTTFDAMANELSQSSPGESHCLVVLDVDEFKLINDSLGHSIGDAVLRHVAATLTGLGRAGDAVARYGGDEFVVLLPKTPYAVGEAFAARVGQALASTPVRVEGDLHVTAHVSVGVGVMDDSVDAAGALRAADAAMYHAKRARKRATSAASGHGPLDQEPGG